MSGLWRNGSASDSRSEGREFESLWPQSMHRMPQQAALSGRYVVAKGYPPWWLPSPAPSCDASVRALPQLRKNRAACLSWPQRSLCCRHRLSAVVAAIACSELRRLSTCPSSAAGGWGRLLGLASRGYGATAARLTPDQKVGSSNLSGLIFGAGCRLPGRRAQTSAGQAPILTLKCGSSRRVGAMAQRQRV